MAEVRRNARTRWHRNEFESEGHVEKFLSCPPLFLSQQVQLVVSVSAFVVVSMQFGQFIVCCLPVVKVGARAPPPRDLWSRRHCPYSHTFY